MTEIRKTALSQFKDFYTDVNHVSVGFDGSGEFLVKIHQPSNCNANVIIHGTTELLDLIELLEVIHEEFTSEEPAF